MLNPIQCLILHVEKDVISERHISFIVASQWATKYLLCEWKHGAFCSNRRSRSSYDQIQLIVNIQSNDKNDQIL